ncbi:hypothetical protein ACFZDG_21035 [Kitasatospora xanthocidica]|uniref:hypothetical protein n=1 Tax=Kitasatospora xanthocidica TaxID=83382 RepID=UPI0036E29221
MIAVRFMAVLLKFCSMKISQKIRDEHGDGARAVAGMRAMSEEFKAQGKPGCTCHSPTDIAPTRALLQGPFLEQRFGVAGSGLRSGAGPAQWPLLRGNALGDAGPRLG